MAKIRSKDTSIEIIARRWLYKQGFRFRKNVKELPGKPDIVLKKYNTIIFIHGCFWHRHSDPDCKDSHIPKSRIDYWTEKLNRNAANDIKHREALESMGWKVITIWQCELEKDFDNTMLKLVEKLYLNLTNKKSS